LPVTGNRQRQWDLVTFLLAGMDLFPSLLFSLEEPPLPFLEVLLVRATTQSLKILYVTASVPRKLKKGVLETHAKRSTYHRAVKSAVRASKAKIAYCI
jgi:hypothetical protein